MIANTYKTYIFILPAYTSLEWNTLSGLVDFSANTNLYNKIIDIDILSSSLFSFLPWAQKTKKIKKIRKIKKNKKTKILTIGPRHGFILSAFLN